MYSYQSFLLFSLSLFLKLQLSNGFDYCVDSLCPFKCCQDFYTCAVTSDCASTNQPYVWPYPEGHSCSGDGDCTTDCCNSSSCKAKSTCTLIKGVVAGCISLGFLIILWIIHYVIRRRRLRKEKNAYSVIHAAGVNLDETANSTQAAHNSENFNPQGYCEDKLAMNRAEGAAFGVMPAKPLSQMNIIQSNFRITTQ